ncbi:glycine receptor subunit alpha-2-like [Amphiura filiformis]|uniref:glycine receptor subunit alpha-2-like n=1 Tax=Amphiura filiformis TaxID=82378 RepID=UPI003B20CB47
MAGICAKILLWIFVGCVNHSVILMMFFSYISSPFASANTTVVLSKLLSNYDPRIRPGSEGPPTNVRVGMYVESLGPIRESTLDFSVTMYFRMRWHDHRLSYQNDNVTELVLKNNDMEKLWVPDLYFLYEKNSHHHFVTQANKLMWVYPNGSALVSSRISVTVACNMNLKNFPMDAQSCTLQIMSYAYSIKDLILTIHDEDLEKPENLTVSKFDIVDIQTSNMNLTYAIGDYSVAFVSFYFQRQMQSYILAAYVPSLLLVVLAWVSFWIDAQAAPARVSLGVTTVLTATTLTASTQESLPTETHAKAIDVWLVACLIFVFLALLEYAMANYLIVLQQTAMIKEAASKSSRNLSVKSKQKEDGHQMNKPVTFADLQTVFWIKSNDVTSPPIRELSPDNANVEWSADSLDRLSRVIFPLAFITFNIVYWPIYSII